MAVVRGFAYPLQLGADGQLQLAEDISVVEQNNQLTSGSSAPVRITDIEEM